MNRHFKRAAAVLAAAAVTVCSATTAFAVWEKGDGSWRWMENGQPAIGWEKVDGKWYYFSAEGRMQTGWVKDAGKWYYLNAGGDMAFGWQQLDGKWYFLGGDGSMATGWRMSAGKWYFLDNSGSMATGWRLVNGVWYYLNAGGDMAVGWTDVKGSRYFMDENGAMQAGVIEIDGDVYYFDENGVMATGQVEIGGKTYRFGSNGKAIGRHPTPDKSFGEKKPSTNRPSYGGGTDTPDDDDQPTTPPEEDVNPLTTAVSAVRTEESAAQIRFTAKEPGYFYCYIPGSTRMRAAAAEPGKDTIVENGRQFGIKAGENVISLTGLTEDTSYTLYTAAENLYQEVTVFEPVAVSNTVDPEAVVAESDKNVAIERVTATSGQVLVQLSRALDEALVKEDFKIYCPAGQSMTILSVTTTDNQNYTLQTTYYRENTYFMEITLPGGKTLQQYFTGRFDCPEITDPSAERTAAAKALFVFASDRDGGLYYLLKEKSAARSSAPTEDEVKNGAKATLAAQLNRVIISGLAANTAYDLYYLAVDTEGKSTPVLGPVAISAKAAPPASASMIGCAAIDDDKFNVIFDKPVSGLTLSNFALNCPRGSIKLGGLTTSDGGKTYTVSLKPGSMFKEKVNFTVTVVLPDGSVTKGIFYTDLYGPMLFGIRPSRYADNTVGVVCTSDRPGYIYCMPSDLDYDPNGPRPTVADVVANGQKFPLVGGSNKITVPNVKTTDTTIWYVTENTGGIQLNYVDHFALSDEIVTPPDESEAPYILSSISGTKKQLNVTIQDVKDNGYFSQMIGNEEVSVSGTTTSGQSMYKEGSKYFSVRSDYDTRIYHIETWGGWEFEPGDYTLTWKYEGFWLNEESIKPDIPGATVTIDFTVGADGNVSAR